MENIYNKNNKIISIEDYQHPSEKKAMEKLIKLPGFNKALSFISEKSIEKSYYILNDSSKMKISKDMSPKIHTMLAEARKMFEVKTTPAVYLERNYTMMVELNGIKSPFIIISSSVLEQYNDSMLWAMLASEVAGIKVRFSEIKLVSKMIDMAKGAFPFAIDAALTIAINDWWRCNSYTYDRAFLLASESFEMAAKHILYGEVDPATLDNLHLDQPDNDYYKQAKEFLDSCGSQGVYQKLATIFTRGQWAASRYVELYNWYFSGMYDDVIERSINR